MRSWVRLIRRAIHPRRITAWCLLIALAAASIGIPIPISAVRGKSQVGKDHSRPFPCQDRPCGCRSAEQCWRKCCCFSDDQKLAWARAHRVTPPDFVVAAARATHAQPRRACCQHDASPASPASQSRANHHPTGIVIVSAALECQGLASLWTVVFTALPPTVSAAWRNDAPRVGIVVVADAHADSVRPSPPVPPPRG